MTSLYALWLPILASAVIVYIASTIIHMVLPAWHKNDFPKLPDEDKAMDALRPLAIPPGDYCMPRPASMQEMKAPEFLEKRARGPVVIMTVLPSGPATMGKPLTLWFVFCIVVGLFAAYVASSTLPPGTPYPKIFQVVGTTAFVGYALGLWPTSIWYGRKWSTTIRSTIDGFIYALLTGGTFGWLWPH
ncbi:MAG TPA: hypothetical protein VGW79_04410 [Actinomycetota bacterium]|nr:hypothetical protein [Actinomycetota bacterium]